MDWGIWFWLRSFNGRSEPVIRQSELSFLSFPKDQADNESVLVPKDDPNER